MKKFYSFAILLLTFTEAFSQIPNAGMESWVTKMGFSNYEEPDKWATANVLSTIPNSNIKKSVTKVPGQTGNGAQIETIVIPQGINPAPGVIPDTLGFMFVGQVNFFAQTFEYGFPYNKRAEKLTFYYRYEPNGADTGYVEVILTKRNQSKKDTLGKGSFKIYGTTFIPEYTFHELAINYDPTKQGNPDTAIVYAASSGYIGPKEGSVLYVDDFAFVEPLVNGIEKDKSLIQATVSSDPLNSLIHIAVPSLYFNKLQLLDITGREVKTYSVSESTATISTEVLPKGIYIYRAIDKSNRLVSIGKIGVSGR